MKVKALARWIGDGFDRLAGWWAWLACGALLVITLITSLDGVLRYGFRLGIAGIWEITGGYLMAAIVFLPLAYTQMKRGHVTIDVLVTRLRPRQQAASEALGLALALVVYALISWYGVVGALHAWRTGDTLMFFPWPSWPARAAVPIGGFLLCLQLLAHFFHSLGQVLRKSS